MSFYVCGLAGQVHIPNAMLMVLSVSFSKDFSLGSRGSYISKDTAPDFSGDTAPWGRGAGPTASYLSGEKPGHGFQFCFVGFLILHLFLLGCLVGWSFSVSFYVRDPAGQVHVPNAMLIFSVFFLLEESPFLACRGLYISKNPWFALRSFYTLENLFWS